LRQLRVEWAAQQLRETTSPIAEISCAAGFSDQSHFTRVFGRAMGVSPAAYRRRAM
jgi:AraC-like DNA-binding protein